MDLFQKKKGVFWYGQNTNTDCVAYKDYSIHCFIFMVLYQMLQYKLVL